MSRRLAALDRTVVLILGLALLAVGLLALDWRFRLVSDAYPDEVSLGGAGSFTEAPWWPWAVAGAGLVLGILGLVWLVLHLARPSVEELGLGESRADGRLRVDLSSLAGAVGDQLTMLAPLDHVRTRTAGTPTHPVLQVRADLAPGARGPDIQRAAAQCAEDLRRALPDTDVRLQLMVDAPRRRPLQRTTSARVQ